MTNNKIRFTFRMPIELKKKVDKRAKKRGTSSNALIIQILQEHFEKQKI